MIRFVSAMIALLFFLSIASASLAPKKAHPGTTDRPAPEANPRAQDHGLVITEETEIKLDGRACNYADVPPNAIITLLDVAPNHQTVRKIYFRSKK